MSNLHGPVRSPNSAGAGTATVKLSFNAWQEGQVLPAVYDVQVLAPRAGPKPEPVSPRLTKTLVHPDRRTLIRSVFFGPGDQWVAGAGFPAGGLTVWDAATGRELHSLALPEDYLSLADPLPPPADGRRLFLPLTWERRVAVTDDGKPAVREEVDGEIQVWELPEARKLPPLRHRPPRGVRSMAVSPDGTRIAALERRVADGTRTRDVLTVWDVKAQTARDLDEGPWVAALSPDGKTLAAGSARTSAGRASTLVLWDAAGGGRKAVLHVMTGGDYGPPVFSPDGRYLAAAVNAPGERPPEVKLWEVRTGKEVGSFAGPAKTYFNRLAFAPGGGVLTATNPKGRVFLYDLPPGKPARVINVEGDPGLRDPAFSPDGRWLAVPGQHLPEGVRRIANENPVTLPQPRVFLFDLASGGAPEVMVAPHGFVGRAAFSRSGRALALGGWGCVWLFDLTRPPAAK